MGFDANVEILRMAFWQIILAAGPVLAIALAVGLVIGIIQAATSINEMTLSFVPKLIIVIVSFALLANFYVYAPQQLFCPLFLIGSVRLVKSWIRW